jgi:hypothetical protein
LDGIEMHPIFLLTWMELGWRLTNIHDARNFDEYTQVLAGDTTNKIAFRS